MKRSDRNKYPRKYQTDLLNKCLKSGFLIPTDVQLVWGIKGFISYKGLIHVEEIKGQFLGGGIHEIYGYRVTLGYKVFTVRHWGYALKSVYHYIVKNFPDLQLPD